MYRRAIESLKAWKTSPYRKPLLLNGVRQVGKTWLLNEFGRLCYQHTVTINFERDQAFRDLFVSTKNPKSIVETIEKFTMTPIKENDTLLIFDEIQECPEAITCLKYFEEDFPRIQVACAGSLLGISLAQGNTFPVGKVDTMDLYPMTFSEFLRATSGENLLAYIESINSIEEIPAAFFNPLMEALKTYFLTGGMPEPIRHWVETHDMAMVQETLENLTEAYERDFAKHPSASTAQKIRLIWNSLPSQLARENKKFLYGAVKSGARAREYEEALEWLKNSGLVKKIYRTKAPRLPLSAYDDLSAFKLYFSDIGILRVLSGLPPYAIMERNRLFTEFKGTMTENYVLQSLLASHKIVPRYWSVLNPSHEVEFVQQTSDGVVLPIEVKAETNVSSSSLKSFKSIFPDETPLRVRFSMLNLTLDGDLFNIPLFLADQMDRLIAIARQSLGTDESKSKKSASSRGPQ